MKISRPFGLSPLQENLRARPLYVDNQIIISANGGHRWSDKYNHNVCRSFIEAVLGGSVVGVTSVWTFMGLLRRNKAIGGMEETFKIINQLKEGLFCIYPITSKDIILAGELVEDHDGLNLEDALHAAVMLNNNIDWIVTFDSHFKMVAGLQVVKPGKVVGD